MTFLLAALLLIAIFPFVVWPLLRGEHEDEP